MRIRTNVLDLDPRDHSAAVGLVASPPCPTFSASDSRSATHDVDLLHDVVTGVGWWEADDDGEPADWSPVSWEDVESWIADFEDPRTPLFAKAMWLSTRLPRLQWIAFEQVPGAAPLFDDIGVELESVGWDVDMALIDATHVGSASRRERIFLTASRLSTQPKIQLPPTLPRSVDSPRARLASGSSDEYTRAEAHSRWQ